jgi:hypothetical protein
MSYLDKYVESSNADLRAEAILNTLQNKLLKQAKPPKEKEVNIQDLRKLKNKGYTDELKAEASMNALQKKLFTKAKQDNPEFNTYQKLADRDRADLAFEIQLKTISDNATKKPSDIKSEPMSGVSQAMIEDYQAEQMQPVEIEGEFFKYHPAGADKVVLDPPPILEPVISERDLRRAKRDLETRATEIERLKQQISIITQTLEQDKTKFDINIGKVTGNTKKEKAERKRLTDAYDANKIVLNDLIKLNRTEILTYEAQIEAIQQQISDSDEAQKRNEQAEYNVNQANKQKLDNLTDLLRSLNQAKNLVINREVGESDADYLQRLQDIGATTYSADEVRDLANLKNIGQTKQNLKSFFSDNGRIQTIAKMLTADERFLFNKLFLKVKKNYLEVYGFDNKQVSNEDVVSFINAISSRPAQGTTAEEVLKTLAEEDSKRKPSRADEEGIPIPKARVGSFVVPDDLPALGVEGEPDLQFGEPVVPEAAAKPDVAVAEALKYVGGDELKIYARSRGVNIKGLTRNVDIMRAMNDAKVEIPDDIIKMLFKKSDQEEARNLNKKLGPQTGKGIKSKSKSKSKPAVKGINVREIPPLMKFGRVYITADQLYYNNLLGIRNKNNRQVTGIPNIIVSDTLVHLIFKILDGGSLTKSDLSVLKPSEKVVYDKLMKLSGFHKSVVNSVDETLSEMKKRLELISGEIEAGNDNKELLKEAHGILFSMAQMNIITHVAASQYYKDLKSYF